VDQGLLMMVAVAERVVIAQVLEHQVAERLLKIH
jgi:hypothetical protein